jgi:hypothetical protein
MKRPLVPLLLLVVLALVAASAAPAQEVERPPTELWDEFPLEATATPSPAAATPQATPSPHVVRQPESNGMSAPALAADPPAPPAPKNAQPKRRSARPEPGSGPAKRRTAKPDPTAGETKRRAPKPARPPTSRPKREDAKPPIGTPPEPTPARAATPEPIPAPAAPPRPFVAPASPAFEACRIRLHNRSIKAHFFAVPYDGGPVFARSPYFKIRRAEDEPGVSAPEALRALVDELTAAGWRQTSAGRAPWDLRFERATSAHEPVAPRRAR